MLCLQYFSRTCEEKEKVLMIDLDPQANLTLSYGIKDVKNGIYEVLIGEAQPKDVNQKTSQ
jgi:cellulose biosynthesis protein BcsQ